MTGDFRRYSYSTDASYALKAFDLQRSSAAPEYEEKKKKELRVRENGGRKTKEQLLAEQSMSRAVSVRVVAFATACFVLLAAMLCVNVKKNELIHQVSSLQTQLSISQSEGTRLGSELDALVSVSMIDRYAVENLGMSKMKSNQIRYIDVNQYREDRFNAAQRLLENEKETSKTKPLATSVKK